MEVDFGEYGRISAREWQFKAPKTWLALLRFAKKGGENSLELLGFTSQTVTNFNEKDNCPIRWLARMAVQSDS